MGIYWTGIGMYEPPQQTNCLSCCPLPSPTRVRYRDDLSSSPDFFWITWPLSAPREGDARRRSLYAQTGSPSRHSGCDCHVQWRRLSFMPGLSPSPLTSVLGGAVRVPPSRGTPSKPCPSMCVCLIGPLAIKYTHKSCVYASQSLMLLWRSDWGPFQLPLNTHQVN